MFDFIFLKSRQNDLRGRFSQTSATIKEFERHKQVINEMKKIRGNVDGREKSREEPIVTYFPH
jgi:hypothetical protein